MPKEKRSSKEKTQQAPKPVHSVVPKVHLLLPFHKPGWEKVRREIGKPVLTPVQLIENLTRLAYATGILKTRTQYAGLTNLWASASRDNPVLCNTFMTRTLPMMKRLLRRMPKVFPEPIKLLKKGARGSITLSEKQTLCLLCAGFFQLLPETANSDKIGSLNFRKLYRAPAHFESQVQKFLCLLHFFVKSFASRTSEGQEGEPDIQAAGGAEWIVGDEGEDAEVEVGEGEGEGIEGEGEGRAEGAAGDGHDAAGGEGADEAALGATAGKGVMESLADVGGDSDDEEDGKEDQEMLYIVISRRVLSDQGDPDSLFWESSTAPLQYLDFAGDAKEETGERRKTEEAQAVGIQEKDPSAGRLLPSIFSSQIGVDVLGTAVEQKDVCFLQFPQALVANCLCEKLAPNENLSIRGVRRFVATEGVKDSFRLVGPVEDECPVSPSGVRLRELTTAFASTSGTGKDKEKEKDKNPSAQFEPNEIVSELNRLFLSLNPALGLKGLRDAQASGKAPAEHQTKQKAKESSAKSIGVLGLSQAVTASVRAPSGTTLPSLGQSMAESLAPSAEEHAEAPAETTKSRADKSRREPHVETVNRVQSPRQVDKSLPAVRASWNAPVWDSDETVKAERPRSVLASLGSDKKHGLLGGGTGGVIELRTLLLWVAASVAGRPLSLVFPETSPSGGVARPESAGSERERKGGAEAGQLKGLPERTDLRALREMCEKKGVTAGQLVNILLNESRSLSEGLSLCHLIFHRLELGV